MAWKVFPITAGAKTPALTGDWRSHATDDQTQIDAWLAEGYDLGVDCEASGLFVIDVDGEIGEQTLKTLEALPPTYTVRTRSGGRHLYFRGSGPSTVQKLGPKVDTRGAGGYVVWDAPDYDVLDSRTPAPLSAWVVPALNQTKSRKLATVDIEDLPHNVSRARAYLKTREPAVEGQGGNDHTYQTAAALRDLGVSEDKSLELMLEDWNERCDPPWDADELAQVVTHAWEYAQNEAGAQAIAGDPRERFAGAVPPAGPAPDVGRYRLWTVPEALTRPPPSWLFPGILPARSVGVAYGPQETGKTWLLLDQALHLATGVAGYGRGESEPQDVVYFAGEGFADLVHARIHAWCAYHQDLPAAALDHFRLLEDFPNVADDADVDILVKQVVDKRLQPRLMILDTYSRVLAQAGLNENDPLDVMKFVRQAEILKRGFDCTVVAIAHAGKELERGVRGSNALISNVDFGYEISANWDVKALQLTCAKMKGAAHFKPMHFEAIPQGDSLVVRGITPDAYRALTTVEDTFSSRAIGIALAQLGARDPDHAVTAYVLAQHLHTPAATEPEQETHATIDRLARKLSAMGKGRLEQYTSRAGWHLPS